MNIEYVKQIKIFNNGSHDNLFYFCCSDCINKDRCKIKPKSENPCFIEQIINATVGRYAKTTDKRTFITSFYLVLYRERWKKFKDLKRNLNETFKNKTANEKN